MGKLDLFVSKWKFFLSIINLNLKVDECKKFNAFLKVEN
jgi:hypothetical protein